MSKVWRFVLFALVWQYSTNQNQYNKGTLASGIDVGQGINVGPGKFGKKNKRRALNTHVLCSK